MLGIDVCKAGWVGIVLSQGTVSAHLAAKSAISSKTPAAAARCRSSPSTFRSAARQGRRQADLLIRKAVGPRWASVFMTPVRPSLEAADFATATAASRRLAGEGISRQAFALQAKILQVDNWVRQTRHRVVEVHPEASFAQLAGAPLHSAKSTWAGIARRRQLLTEAGIVLPDDLGTAGEKAAVDDVLDAAAAAWTAMRVIRYQARPHPDPPELFSDGLASAIWI